MPRSLEDLSPELLAQTFKMIMPITPWTLQPDLLLLSKKLFPSVQESLYENIVLRAGHNGICRLVQTLNNNPSLACHIQGFEFQAYEYGHEFVDEINIQALIGIFTTPGFSPSKISISVQHYQPEIWNALPMNKVENLSIRCVSSDQNTLSRWVNLVIKARSTLKHLELRELGDRSKRGALLLDKLAASSSQDSISTDSNASTIAFPALVSLSIELPDMWMQDPIAFSNDMVPFMHSLLSRTSKKFTTLALDGRASPLLLLCALHFRGNQILHLHGLRPSQLPGVTTQSQLDDWEEEGESGYGSQDDVSESDSESEPLQKKLGLPLRIQDGESLAMLAPNLISLQIERASRIPYHTLPDNLKELDLLLPDEEAKRRLANLLQHGYEGRVILSGLKRLKVKTDSEGTEVIRPTSLAVSCAKRAIALVETF